MRVVDGDSHFMEPLDLFERYIDPAFRDRTLKLASSAISTRRFATARSSSRTTPPRASA